VLNEIAILKPILEERFRRIAEKEIAEYESGLQSMQKPESSPRPPSLQAQQTFVPYKDWNLAEQLKGLPLSQPTFNNMYVKFFDFLSLVFD